MHCYLWQADGVTLISARECHGDKEARARAGKRKRKRVRRGENNVDLDGAQPPAPPDARRLRPVKPSQDPIDPSLVPPSSILPLSLQHHPLTPCCIAHPPPSFCLPCASAATTPAFASTTFHNPRQPKTRRVIRGPDKLPPNQPGQPSHQPYPPAISGFRVRRPCLHPIGQQPRLANNTPPLLRLLLPLAAHFLRARRDSAQAHVDCGRLCSPTTPSPPATPGLVRLPA